MNEFTSVSRGISLSYSNCKQGICSQTIVIIPVFVTQCKSVDPLRDKLLNSVFNAGGIPVILKAAGKLLQDTNSGFDLSEKKDSSIAGDMAPIKFSNYFPATKPLKSEL